MGRTDLRNTLKVACVYTTVIIGAGFASGQELLKFFADYGYEGIGGLIVSGILFAAVGWAVLDICRVCHFTGYRELMNYICGAKIGLVIEIAVAFFMYILYSTMLAGVGATFRQVFQFNFTASVCFAAALTFAALLLDADGLVAVNGRAAPFLVAGGLMIGALTLWRQTRPVFAHGLVTHWLFAAVVYASYNIITAVSVLSALSGFTKTPKAAKWSGILGGGIMTLLGLCMIFPLLLYYAKVSLAEIPLLSIAQSFGPIVEYIYLMLLLCAIFTTAISNLFALVRWLTDRFGIPAMPAKIILSLGGCLTAHIGFSHFVGRVYPIFSLVGFAEIIMILAAWAKCKKHGEKT